MMAALRESEEQVQAMQGTVRREQVIQPVSCWTVALLKEGKEELTTSHCLTAEVLLSPVSLE